MKILMQPRVERMVHSMLTSRVLLQIRAQAGDNAISSDGLTKLSQFTFHDGERPPTLHWFDIKISLDSKRYLYGLGNNYNKELIRNQSRRKARVTWEMTKTRMKDLNEPFVVVVFPAIFWCTYRHEGSIYNSSNISHCVVYSLMTIMQSQPELRRGND